MDQLTFTMENYLEAIYELSSEGETGARLSDIAKRLGVTKASTNSAMATLSEKGLITNEKYKKIFLTAQGKDIAQQTTQKHRVIYEFFTKILDIDPHIADKDACAIEHVISKETIKAIQEYLSGTNSK